MAESLKRSAAVVVVLAIAGANPAQASGDPTRPPLGFSEKQVDPSEGKPQLAPPVLTGVFLMGQRPYALIDSQTVHVGDKLAEGLVVTQIDEQGVWLRSPSGPRQLKLLPRVRKTPSDRARMEMKR